MIKNYFKIATRNLARYKGYSLLNITGLAVGMACCILIMLWVQDELSYDRFHEKGENLYRVIDYEKYSDGEEVTFSTNAALLGPILKDEYPEILDYTRVRGYRNAVISHGDENYNQSGVLFADPSLFTMFSYNFKKGDASNCLSDHTSAVISDDAPANSHLGFELILPFMNLKDFGYNIDTWNSYAFPTYVLLDDHADYHLVSEKITNEIIENDPEAIATLSLQPILDIHLHSGNMWGGGGTGDIKYVIIFSIIATLILLLACINYMNLTTARLTMRAKEVGLRKVIGANRKEIMAQFYGESLLFTSIALLVALILTELMLPLFNTLSGKELNLDIMGNSLIFLVIIGTAATAGLIAGSYPAILLSALTPVKVLRGKLRMGAGSAALRRFLVITQFVVTIALLISALLVSRQLKYIGSQKLGYDQEHLLSIELPGNLNEKTEWIKSELLKDTSILAATAVSKAPVDVRWGTLINEWEGKDNDDQFLIYMMSADFDFASTLDIGMADGRFFDRAFLSQDTTESIILNETAAAMMGFEEPIGKKVFTSPIIGVIEDFHFQSLHEKIGPLMLFHGTDSFGELMVKMKADDVRTSIASLEETWKRLVPEFPLEYRFFDEQLDKLYQADQRVEQIVNSFTLLAFFIACLGLFGLSAFTAERRTKEIGVRKVLGANVASIVSLMSKEFLLLVAIAYSIACPVAYYVMGKWLDNFAFRTEQEWWIFAGAGILAFLIALMTVSFQAIRVANTNPIKSLRYE